MNTSHRKGMARVCFTLPDELVAAIDDAARKFDPYSPNRSFWARHAFAAQIKAERDAAMEAA